MHLGNFFCESSPCGSDARRRQSQELEIVQLLPDRVRSTLLCSKVTAIVQRARRVWRQRWVNFRFARGNGTRGNAERPLGFRAKRDLIHASPVLLGEDVLRAVRVLVLLLNDRRSPWTQLALKQLLSLVSRDLQERRVGLFARARVVRLCSLVL